MKKKSTGQTKTRAPIPFHPWAYFFLFLVSNSLLAYFNLPLTAKLWIGLFGLVFPFGVASWTLLEKRFQNPEPVLPYPRLIPLSLDVTPPLWLWMVGGGLLLFTRFYRLSSVPSWPLSDEGIFATLAMNFSRHGDSRWLWAEGRIEPLLIWSLGAFFRILEPSLTSLRLFPALLSLGTVLLAYPCVKPFLPRFSAFAFSWFFAFSFWEFSLMRFVTPEDFIPLFQLVSLGLLGRFLLAKSVKSRWQWLVALGFCEALGFYAYINWAPVWLVTLLVLGIHAFRNQKDGLKWIGFFLLATLTPLIPLLLARLEPGGLLYMKSIWGNFLSVKTYFSYGSALFWNSRNSFPFGPNWGGMLDPITGSLVLLGILGMIKNSDFRRGALLAGGLWICLLPGTVTNYTELHRITPSLPFWMLFTAVGVQGLVPAQQPGMAWVRLFGLGLLTFFLNFYNFTGPYCDITRVSPVRQWRSVQYEHAYGILKRQSDESAGSLYVFSEFNTDYDNKTLNLAVYPFDVLQNPALAAATPRWAGVIVNIHYAPWILNRFPGTRVMVLKTDKMAPGDPPPFGIFLIPVSQIPSPVLKNWIEADRVYRQSNLRIKNKSLADAWSRYISPPSDFPAGFRPDRFLEAVYWEKYAFYTFLDQDFKPAAEAYQKAIQQGVPAAHLYYDWGVSLRFQGERTKAEMAFQKARTLP